jgi:hypothetical protein
MRKIIKLMFCLVLVPQVAPAQILFNGFTYFSPAPIPIPPPFLASGNPNDSVRTNQPNLPRRPVISSASLSFPTSIANRKRNLAQFVAKTRAQSPENADQMAALFASGDVIGQLGQAIAPFGLRTNNVADAYTLYWINAWEASRGITNSAGSRAQVQAVRKQAEAALLATPEVANLTAVQKQEFAESMLIQAMLISSSAETFAADPVMLRKVSAAVTQGAKAFSLDLDAMTLTDEGFKPEKRRKSGAVDDEGKAINPTAEPTATAQNDAPPQSGGSTTQYALIAAAGGAGLAGVFMLGKMMGKKG